MAMPFPYPKIISRETALPSPDFYRCPMPSLADAQCPIPFNSFATLSVFCEQIAAISELLDKLLFRVLQILID